MNSSNVFSRAFFTALRQWRVVGIVYIIQLCLAFTLGMEVHNVLQASIGNSLEINKLINGYDHTVFSDFLKIHGASITPLIGQLRWLLLVWLLFSVFTNAGMLYASTQPEQVSARPFWEGGSRYFFSFLKMSLVILLPVLVWTSLIFVPLGMHLQPALENSTSEATVVWPVIGILLLYLLGLVKFYIWSVVSRIYRLQHDVSIPTALKAGLRIFRKKVWRLLAFVLAFLALQLFLLVLYWWLESISGMTSPALILVFFLIQQAFSFFKILIRQCLYAGIVRV